MTDESCLEETNKEIWRHLKTPLHSQMNDSEFCPQGEPFYI